MESESLRKRNIIFFILLYFFGEKIKKRIEIAEKICYNRFKTTTS